MNYGVTVDSSANSKPINSAMNKQSEDDFVSKYGLVPRDRSTLFQVPFKQRWEYTRRHPYYLLCWRDARAFLRGEVPPDSAQFETGFVANLLLGMIGVTGEPQDPALDFGALGDFDLAFLSGTLQPLTVRAMIIGIVCQIAPAELRVISGILETLWSDEYAIPGDEDRRLRILRAQQMITRLASPLLDSCPVLPLYHIHMEASQRRIVEDVESVVSRWKKQRGIKEQRVHIDKLPEYLKIWDAREGSVNGNYDLHAERTFDQITRAMRKPKSTVANGYREAFRWMTGHEFSSELWLRLMLAVKAPDLCRDATDKLTARYRRLMSANSLKPVPETKLQAGTSDEDRMRIVEQESAVAGNLKQVELELDIAELIDKGRSDQEIAEELEISNLETVSYIRGRLCEFPRAAPHRRSTMQ
jgi:hypothetical protein